MLNLAVMRKTLRQYLPLWGAMLALLVGFVLLFMIAVNQVALEKQEFLRLPVIRRFLTIMSGTDPLSLMGPTTITALAFTHPLVWILLGVFTLTVASGVLAGEMDRGTMDLLATLPVSRASIYSSAGVVLLGMGMTMCWGVWLGAAVGRVVLRQSEVRLDLLVRVTWHLCATWGLIMALALALSAMSSRRGPAVAAAFFILFYSFVLNVLRAMWPAMDALAWSGLMHYYQPLVVVRDEAYRWRDLAVLVSASVAWWAAGWMVFARRDIPAR
jgi:ABC-type transport system involved in multi-copper enzyme maturation permease subunit